MDISQLYNKYKGISTRKLSGDDKDYLKENLSRTLPGELRTLDEHKMFVELINLLRRAILEDFSRAGDNFVNTIKDVLSTGADGVYSSKMHFLYELIQNVDDCEFDDPENRKLGIKFDPINDTIELEYNEKGFTPFNVFAITGIAEKAKNISSGKVEIGEKGIGFKSVFGIAESVLIQSGMFSFELFAEDFIVPKPRYESFSPREGTRLTLKLKPKTALGLYRDIVKRYSDYNALLSGNPVLFLNKLTELSYFIDDSCRYMRFHVTRQFDSAKERTVEHNVKLSVDIMDADNDNQINNEITCCRYNMPIKYDRAAWVSRYGDKFKVDSDKIHHLIAVIPYPEELAKVKDSGALYSFLPTQIKMNMPLAFHAPYKLGSSREFVDAQGENLWFSCTNVQVSEFFKWVYSDWAKHVKRKIVSYLPKRHEYFFFHENDDNENLKPLRKQILRGDSLLSERLFCADGMKPAADVVSFAANENINEPEKVHSLLGIGKSLFVPEPTVNMTAFMVEVIGNALNRLFKAAMDNSSIASQAFEMLNAAKEFDFAKAIDSVGVKTVSMAHISAICSGAKSREAFERSAISRIKQKQHLYYHVNNPLMFLDESAQRLINEAVSSESNDSPLMKYLKLTGKRCTVSPLIPEGRFFVCANMLILSDKMPLDAFASFARLLSCKTIASSLEIQQESEALNTVKEGSMKHSEYLRMLARSRKSIRSIMGETVYDNFVKLINNSGESKSRFISELLQNADDCSYEKASEKPCFSCELDSGEMTTYYNEDGFTMANVRSITAIGESTKRKIAEGKGHIGEKGVGFKTVFALADEVAIHSNGFHFKLTAEKPTIPQSTEKIAVSSGTKMIFTLKKNEPVITFSVAQALSLCLCLRKLKTIELGDFRVEIEDLPDKRKIVVNGETYVFRKFEYAFSVNSEIAIRERANFQRKVSPQQVICIYTPDNRKTAEKTNTRHLYAGLPTSINVKVPLIIDAPFETTTSRESVVESRWNTIIREHCYNAIIEMLQKIKHEKRNNVLEYVNKDGIFANRWLNDYKFKDKLSGEDIVCLIDGRFAAPRKTECFIYPEVLLHLFKQGVVAPGRAIVDAKNHIQALEWLGCKQVALADELGTLNDVVNRGHMSDESFRKRLYSYLDEKAKKIRGDTSCNNLLKNMKIIPLKPKLGNKTSYTSFVSSGHMNNVYTSAEHRSCDEYDVLEDSVLTAEKIFEFFGKIVPRMDEQQRKSRFLEGVKKLIREPDKKYVAETLLEYYMNRRKELEFCKNELKGQVYHVPVKLSDGTYRIGDKLANDSGYPFSGAFFKSKIVDDEYADFAQYLGCKDLLSIHYDDLHSTVHLLEDRDVEDLLYGNFTYMHELLNGFIEDGFISYAQLEKYELQAFDAREPDKDDYEFPAKKVANIQTLRRSIASATLNRIISRQVTRQERVPENMFDKRQYALEQYRCDDDIHFCQMCKTPKKSKYIEVNSIEYEPQYAWEQMQLCLCLTCSKDFENLRNTKGFREGFLDALLEPNPVTHSSSEPIAIDTYNKKIHFTATHLAEVQEILKRQETLRLVAPLDGEEKVRVN